MTFSKVDQQKVFETEVRRIARQLWPEAEYDGGLVIDKRERDGVFETEDCVHLIEATVSRSQEKARADAQKLCELAKKLAPRHSQKAIKCWFVTRDEPTPDQRTVIRDRYPVVTPLSFAQLQSKLVDVGSYLSLRMNYPFGSVRDPANPTSGEDIEYVSLDLIEAKTQHIWSVADIQRSLLQANRFMILGDYGSGKSMTLREVFRALRAEYLKNKTPKFPIYLNLRDHFGQTNPAEVLERHSRNIGFPHPSHLVRAWRAGYVILVVDGFDELTTLGIQGLWKRLQDVRYRAMEAVRLFIKEQSKDAGVIISGRAHFFDSETERRNALHPTSAFVELALNEFNDEQIHRYLKRRGIAENIPDWMPSRPLLVGYLAASGALENVFSVKGDQEHGIATDPARGWDYMIDRVCHREAEIEAGIDGQTVRRILERLATLARKTQAGIGPLSTQDIATAFSEICGYAPDEKGSLLLQRLPGLGIDRSDEGTRVFLDEDFADVCRSGDVATFIENPFDNTLDHFRGLDRGVGGLGIGLIQLKSKSIPLSSGKMIPAIERVASDRELSSLLSDLVRVSLDSGIGIKIPVRLADIVIPNLDLSANMGDCSHLQFNQCLFSRLAIDHDVGQCGLPHFTGCYIEEIEGRASVSDLPKGAFDAECVFGQFTDAPETTNAIVDTGLPPGACVLLTVVRKLYMRSGSGRKENALLRGLDHHSRRLVVPILRLLQTEGIATSYKRGGTEMPIWIPNRSKTRRVQKLIAAPRTCGDVLIQKATELT